jgi:AraC-like DNA-binding protein
MDGFELLYNVRSDKMLCHIPMILLSAQGNVNSKIAGLDYGADAYIEKPFSISYVVATIDNLLKTRRLLFERFTSMPNLDYGKGGMKPNDVEWLEALSDIIKKNLTNEQFTVDTLASEMAVSRSNLRRKVLGVTGLPPNDYIRLYRLNTAARMLNDGCQIKIVVENVGFSSVSYFTSSFVKHFGITPGEYRNKSIKLK